MDDLERERAWDQVIGRLENGLIGEARGGNDAGMLAVGLLRTANGAEHVAVAHDEAGDGEGADPVLHFAARAKAMLREGEAVFVEMVTVTIDSDERWRVAARRARARASRSLDDIFDRGWVSATLQEARKRGEPVRASAAVLVLPTGERRVAMFDREADESEARAQIADLLRRAARMRLLRPGERLERVLLTLTRSKSGWTAVSTPDPLRGPGRTKIRPGPLLRGPR